MTLNAYQAGTTHANRLRVIYQQMLAVAKRGTQRNITYVTMGQWSQVGSYESGFSCLADSRDLQLTPYTDHGMDDLQYKLGQVRQQLIDINNTVPLYDLRFDFTKAMRNFPMKLDVVFKTFENQNRGIMNLFSAQGRADEMYILVSVRPANALNLQFDDADDVSYATLLNDVTIRFRDPIQYMISFGQHDHYLKIHRQTIHGKWVPINVGDDLFKRFVYGFGLDDVLGEGSDIVSRMLKRSSAYDEYLPLTWDFVLSTLTTTKTSIVTPLDVWARKFDVDRSDLAGYFDKLYLWDAYVLCGLITKCALDSKYLRQLVARLRRYSRQYRQPFFVFSNSGGSRTGSRSWLFYILAATEARRRFADQCVDYGIGDVGGIFAEQAEGLMYLDKQFGEVSVMSVLARRFRWLFKLRRPVQLYKQSLHAVCREEYVLNAMVLLLPTRHRGHKL